MAGNIPLESEQIAVEMGFDGIQDEYLVFDFVVFNSLADTLTLLPKDFYYVVLDSANDIFSPIPLGWRCTPINYKSTTTFAWKREKRRRALILFWESSRPVWIFYIIPRAL